jgi:hypothetical protein
MTNLNLLIIIAHLYQVYNYGFIKPMEETPQGHEMGAQSRRDTPRAAGPGPILFSTCDRKSSCHLYLFSL